MTMPDTQCAAAPAPPALPPCGRTGKILEIERDALRAGAVELALASALGDLDAKAALAALPPKLAALQFEIDLNHQAHEMAQGHDAAAEVAWRASIQTLPPEEIIEGIGKESCCRRCQPGAMGGCVITAAAPWAGATCGHPLKEKNMVFGRMKTASGNFYIALARKRRGSSMPPAKN